MALTKTDNLGMSNPQWPSKRDLFGLQISQTDYQSSENVILHAARERIGAVVTHLPVHGIVNAVLDRSYRDRVNRFDLTAPDGQPVRWALNFFHSAGLRDRVYGPELMVRLCRRAVREGVSIYLYGSTPDVVALLCERLVALAPGLKIAGHEAPPFRPLTREEDQAVVERINASGAGIVFIGLGLPKQDHFAFEHRDKIRGVQVCVGAAFELHAGKKRMAPSWMQRGGLEWLYRLKQEPRRLGHRYLTTNAIFLALIGRRLFMGR